jgi:hypothetical protein
VSALVTGRIREHATRLGLTHLTDTISQLVARPETEQLGYLEFVDLLLEEEFGLREGRWFRNALKLSGLPHHKTIDEFDFAFQPDLDARKVRDLASSVSSSAIRLRAATSSARAFLAFGLDSNVRSRICFALKAVVTPYRALGWSCYMAGVIYQRVY